MNKTKILFIVVLLFLVLSASKCMEELFGTNYNIKIINRSTKIITKVTIDGDEVYSGMLNPGEFVFRTENIMQGSNPVLANFSDGTWYQENDQYFPNSCEDNNIEMNIWATTITVTCR